MRNDSATQSRVPNTERSEQKVQGHVPGQGQGVKPIVGSRGKAPSGVCGRASFGASRQGADCSIKSR